MPDGHARIIESSAIVEHEERKALATQQARPLTVQEMSEQLNLLAAYRKSILKEDVHYGVIPGTSKPTLLKAGAEVLCLGFRISVLPEEISVTDLERGHRDYRVVVRGERNGEVVGFGAGECSTMEARYRYRKAEQTCPECGKTTIIKGKKEYGGGWLCWSKKGGCGAKFQDGDESIENQDMGRIEHDNPADYWNTCLKMAKKRALADLALTTTAASADFTQDAEDLDGLIENEPPKGWASQGAKEPPKRTVQRKSESENRRQPAPQAQPQDEPPPRDEPPLSVYENDPEINGDSGPGDAEPPASPRGTPAKVLAVDTKGGKKSDGEAWTRYTITLDMEGKQVKASTFSKSDGALAQAAAEDGTIVYVEVAKSGDRGQFTDLVSIEEAF